MSQLGPGRLRAVAGGLDRLLLWVLAGALLLRVAAALGLHLVSVAQGGDGFWGFAADAYDYEQFGLRQAAGWRAQGPGPVEDVRYSSWYVVFVGALYWAFGEGGRVAGVGVNVLAGVAPVWLTWLLAERLAGRRAAVIAALAMSVFPTQVLWSTQLLKDSLVVTLALAGLLIGLSTARAGVRDQARWLIGLLAVIALLTGLRVYTGLAVTGVVLAHALAVEAAARRAWPVAVVVLVAAFAPLLAGEGFVWTGWAARLAEAEQGQGLEGIRDVYYQQGGAAVENPPCPELSSVGAVAACLPGAFVFGLFEPWPARWFISEGWIERLTPLQLGPWYVLVLLAVAGTVWAARSAGVRFDALALALFVVGYATALGVIVSNYGALVRLRAPFEPVVIVLAAVAVAAWVERLRAGRAG